MSTRRTADLHIYLPERERRELAVWAESESRTLSNLVMHIVRQALASRDGLMPASSHEQLVERIKDATRNGLHKSRRE